MHGAQPKTTTSTKSISRDAIVLLSREECAQYLFLYFFLSHSVFSVKLCIWALHLSSRSTVILAVAFRSSSAVSSIWWSPFASCPLSPQASGLSDSFSIFGLASPQRVFLSGKSSMKTPCRLRDRLRFPLWTLCCTHPCSAVHAQHQSRCPLAYAVCLWEKHQLVTPAWLQYSPWSLPSASLNRKQCPRVGLTSAFSAIIYSFSIGQKSSCNSASPMSVSVSPEHDSPESRWDLLLWRHMPDRFHISSTHAQIIACIDLAW